ncbi:peroxidase [Apis mellifera caucasica]|nr:peroxidase [Apis mellifera caucasica]
MVSYTLFPNVNIDDPIWTLVAMQWGQIITHDMGLIEGSTQSKPHKTKCCTNDGQLVRDPSLLHRTCYPILIPFNDPVYGKTNTRCLNFVRSTTDLDHGCSDRFKPAEQMNVVTHFLDLSIVYGSNDQVAANLRAGVNGRLRVDVRTNREWPPSALNASESCDIVSPVEVCYLAGDTRINQNTQLTVLQIILLREHNRIANALTKLNPHWTDETIFQETRRILIAQHQQISYYEWLPIFIEQLNEIRKTSIARLFCDNGDNIQRMQQRGFEKVSQFNPILNCDDIPSIDLSLWKDYAPTLTTQHISFSNFKK